MTNQFAFPASISTNGHMSSVVAFNAKSDTPMYQANSSHPNWNDILEGLRNGDDKVWGLFDVVTGVMARFNQVTERIAWNGSEVLFDGDPIHSALSEQLARALQGGNSDDYTALAKFWEKLESNPDDHSRAQAYEWLASHKFQITPEGDIVGYKYIYPTDKPGVYRSGHSSGVPGLPSAFVNGVPEKPLSVVYQSIGDVVTMPRSEVVHDPSQPCERGLHVGTYNYVGAGGRTAFVVHVNPRDVVSVPTDGGGEKVRVCRYVAHAMVDGVAPGESAVLRDSNNTWAGDVSTRV